MKYRNYISGKDRLSFLVLFFFFEDPEFLQRKIKPEWYDQIYQYTADFIIYEEVFRNKIGAEWFQCNATQHYQIKLQQLRR